MVANVKRKQYIACIFLPKRVLIDTNRSAHLYPMLRTLVTIGAYGRADRSELINYQNLSANLKSKSRTLRCSYDNHHFPVYNITLVTVVQHCILTRRNHINGSFFPVRNLDKTKIRWSHFRFALQHMKGLCLTYLQLKEIISS